MKLKVVFDTNILFSSLGWQGNPHHCVELARKKIISGVTCPELMEELEEKLQTKLYFSNEMAVDTITDLLGFLELVTITGNLKVIEADPDDDAVLECALVAQADYIISGDRRHLLPIENFQGIPIITATNFLTLHTKNN